ncbi:KpsF/GutQ family sugar-phosphate isomerase [Pararhizobium mangrovi]|uniref:KpsF/GutQ family sugar-phosphate isomerase n=1 Tax=Pararhizobium mangrovi TaxID=2590452 RepID=A0A506UCX8_9HYPH|nr:KpsF/GutQ family sugar-phosphate isomerase [Pararhizobium mangrovi]TPW30655.1 KpsF/GutQ family sugar-phosphate isomerase [Pararhizobium mangrovi]
MAPPSVSHAESSDEAAILERGRTVLRLEGEGLERLRDSLDGNFVAAVAALLELDGRVIVSGLGKSGHVAAKLAATLASTGTPASFVHAAEALHGDMGMISPHDLVILISNSGETAEFMPIVRHLRALGVPIVAISSAAQSKLMRGADIALALPAAAEACPVGIAPTTSTTMMLALGDALAMAVMEERGFTREDFKRLHPGGNIGLKLTAVGELMHTGERLPLVREGTAMADVIVTMTAKSFGIAGVVDAGGALLGAITDGDLRRHIDALSSATAGTVMTRPAKTIDPSMPAEDALKFLNREKVTALFVIDETDGTRRPVGIVHVHDFLRLGLT